MADTSLDVRVPAQPAAPSADTQRAESEGLPLVLPWALLALALYLVAQSLSGLLAEVQLAADTSYGGIETLASGFGPEMVAHAQGLLATWALAAQANPATHDLIVWTVRAHTIVSFLLIVAYAMVLAALWRRVRRHLPSSAGNDATVLGRLRRAAYWQRGSLIALAAAACDAGANALRLYFVEQAVSGSTVPSLAIVAAWTLDTARLVLLVIFGMLLAVLLHDTGRVWVWLRRGWRAAWRLRVVVVVVGIYAALLLLDITGQATDLARRWVDDSTGLIAGALVLAGSLLLGFSVWLYARRVVLSDQLQSRTAVAWTWSLLGFAGVTGAIAFVFTWNELYAFTALAALIVLVGWVVRRRSLLGENATVVAARHRRRDAGRPSDEDVLATRRTARGLAVAVPLSVFLLAAIAYTPVILVLPTSGQQHTATFDLAAAFVVLAIFAAPPLAVGLCTLLRSWDGPLQRTPDRLEWRYVFGAVAVVVLFAVSFAGAVWHWSAITAFLVVAAFLAMLMLILGEAQRWSETHTAPAGAIVLGFTRLPVATLVLLALAGGTFLLNDGHAHDVHRQGTLPAGLTSNGGRTGVELSTAFDQWVAGNCAGSGHSGTSVPLILVSAPGGGLRAAYWTASTLTAMFGPDRSSTVAGCDAAPADRIFAMGGASGGSLGVLSYEAGLTSTRSSTWFVDQLGQPDFLTDPLTWMLTADAARAFIGYGGEDRARRLEDSFASHVNGLGNDFFAGTWGLGGRSPLMLLTATQVETGCRLNVSGFRLTDPNKGAARLGCAALGQSSAPVTTDLLDVLCGAGGHDPMSLSRATAALLSARFPYVSPSGQMYSCLAPGLSGRPDSTAIVDGGYADNTGLRMMLSFWPRLEPLIEAHNQDPHNATIVPVMLDVDNHYAPVAPPSVNGRTVESLVPLLTKPRPAKLTNRADEQEASNTFSGPVPGLAGVCDLTVDQGRFLIVSPLTSPGLPAPLAWTLSRLATNDLDAQRAAAVAKAGPSTLRTWARSAVPCA
jgi:hypothetical protein